MKLFFIGNYCKHVKSAERFLKLVWNLDCSSKMLKQSVILWQIHAHARTLQIGAFASDPLLSFSGYKAHFAWPKPQAL